MDIYQSPKITKLRIIKNIIAISVTFFLLFTAADGLNMLQSTMNKEGGIGVISQAVCYISFCFSALLLPKYIIRKLGCKSSLVFSIGLCLPSIAANFYPTWPLMISSAILSGIGASILWGSQCTYFNESAFQYAKLITNCSDQTDYDGSTKRYKSLEVASDYTSLETIYLKYSKADIVEESQLKDRQSIKDSLEEIKSEDSVVRYRCKITNFDEIEKNSIQYVNNSVENSCTSPTKEESKLDQLENSSINDMSPLTEHIHEIAKKDIHEGAKISNVKEIVKNVAVDINSLINKGIPKSHEGSLPPKGHSFSQQVFQKANTLESVTGIFFGCHSMAFYSAQIVSNAISYFILQGDEQVISYSDGCLCGAQFCNDNSGCISDDTELVSKNMRYLLTGISVIVGVISVVLLVFFVDPLLREKSDDELENSALRHISATISHNKKKEQLCLIPMAFFEGMQLGFYSADFTKAYIGCAWGASNVGLVSVVFGSACVISSLVSGFLVKYAGRRALFLLGQLISILMAVFLLIWEPNSDTTYKFFIAAILFGTTTGIYWSQMLSFYGLLFKEDEEAAFASYHLWDSLGWTASFLYSDYLCTYIKIYMLMAVSIIGTTGYLFTERSYELRKQQGTVM